MSNYSDPHVWQAFLAKHNITSSAPPPPEHLWANESAVNADLLLRSWAERQGPEQQHQEQLENEENLRYILGEIEKGEW